MLFRKKEIVIASPMKGEIVDIKSVPDVTFSEEMLGVGAAILPVDGKVYAPSDGEVSALFPTYHAVGITTEDGTELLVHVGIDTVKLKGEGFKAFVKVGDNVKKGDLLIEADLKKIEEAGYDLSTPVVVCNTGDYKLVISAPHGKVNAGDCLIKISL